VEAAVGDDLLHRIVEQHAVAREAAAHHHVVLPGGGGVEDVAELGQQVLEVAVHRQHPAPGRGPVAVGDRAPHAVGRRAEHGRTRGSSAARRRRIAAVLVAAVVVDRDDLVQVVAVVVAEPRDQRLDVHLLVVAGDDHRDRAVQRRVLGEARALARCDARRLLRVQQDRPREPAYPGRVLEDDRQVAQQPREPARQRRVDEVGGDGEHADEADLRDQLVELRAAQERARVGAADSPAGEPRQQPPHPQHRVPRIALVEDDLSARGEPLVHLLQQPRAVARVEQVERDHAVELAPGEQAGQVLGALPLGAGGAASAARRRGR
jgi:hypothetical protein